MAEMNEYQVVISSRAAQMLVSHAAFLAKVSMEAANKLVDEFEKSADSLKVYPFAFELTIIYALNNNKLQISWLVKNLDEKQMYFSIGAHPAFMIKLDEKGTFAGNYLQFDCRDSLVATDFANGLVLDTTHEIPVDSDGLWAIDEHTFDNGVHILEHDQVQRISIVDNNKDPYVTVEFDTPLVGIWSPEKKNAPFLCIEPWYGRADAANFSGDLQERKYEQSLEPGEVFRGGYQIKLNN